MTVNRPKRGGDTPDRSLWRGRRGTCRGQMRDIGPFTSLKHPPNASMKRFWRQKGSLRYQIRHQY